MAAAMVRSTSGQPSQRHVEKLRNRSVSAAEGELLTTDFQHRHPGAVIGLQLGPVLQVDVADPSDRVAAAGALLEHTLQRRACLVADVAARARVEVDCWQG